MELLPKLGFSLTSGFEIHFLQILNYGFIFVRFYGNSAITVERPTGVTQKIRHFISRKRHNILSKILIYVPLHLLSTCVGLISVVVSLLDFYVASFIFFELGQGVRYPFGSTIFICL